LTARVAEPAIPFAFITLTVVSDGRGALALPIFLCRTDDAVASGAATSGCWKSRIAAAIPAES
jgi:hypothetical protein